MRPKYLLFVLFCFVSAIFLTAFPTKTYASEFLNGSLNITYSPGSGQLVANYTGGSGLSSTATYTWYYNGNSVSTSAYNSYSPTSSGQYYCVLTDTQKYSNSITSQTVYLYTVTGTNIQTGASKNLYMAGTRVTVTTTLNSNEEVTEWKSNVGGLNISGSGSSASFTMPSSDVVITVTKKTRYNIRVIGGKADKYTASQGETVTLTASDVEGKVFQHWTTSQGANINNATNKVASITMPSSDITVTATFLTPEEAKAQGISTVEPENDFADAVRAKFTLVRSNNYKVDVIHHSQGPLCDALFKMCLGGDTLVLDYFNIYINNSYNVLETPTPVGICLHIPADLQVGGRNWRMLCVSRGRVYSFPDCDEDDTTITFFPDRFYAFAMCYNDNVYVEEEVVEEEPEEYVEEEVVEEEPVEEDTPITDVIPASTSHSVTESRTMSSTEHSADESRSLPTYDYETSPYPSPVIITPKAPVKSDKKSSLRMSNGANVSIINI